MKKEDVVRSLAKEAVTLRDEKHYRMKDAVYAVLNAHNVLDPSIRRQLDSDISKHLALRRKAQLAAERERKEFALRQPALPF